jgi:fructose-1,6-bisphosphatase/inositol monophosphatase family enzyme
MTNLFIKLKELIDSSIQDFSIKNSAILKNDGSLVTDLDLHLDLEIRNLYNDFGPVNPIIVSEESYQGDQSESYNLKNRDFLIVDPIDGTENFNFFSFMYGVAISGRIKGVDFDFLYTPFDNTVICGSNDVYQNQTESRIQFFSTASVRNISKKDLMQTSQIRVLGSSSTMFSLLLRGQATSYDYTSGCKIWDCYTGLRLARNANCFKFENLEEDWFENPKFKTKFKIIRK